MGTVQRLTRHFAAIILIFTAHYAFAQPTTDIEVRKGLEYAVHDGARLLGDYYAPRAAGSYPAIVAIHGGGWQAGSPIGYQYWGPWLAQRGYVVFAVGYRFSKPGQSSFPEALHDVRAAIQFIKGRGSELRVNPERVGVMGDSAGGHLSALVALAGDQPQFSNAYRNDPYSAVSTRVKVAIPIYGVFDMYQQWQHDLVARPRDNISEKFLGVSAADDKRAYFDASPLSYVSARNNSTSFLMVWGTRDDIADPATQTEPFMLALKQAGYFVRPVPMEGAPHFWVWDPVDEPNSHNGFLAPRLLRFLQQRL
jgi:acetyl esterase/lipase